jgi:hypothetical protein
MNDMTIIDPYPPSSIDRVSYPVELRELCVQNDDGDFHPVKDVWTVYNTRTGQTYGKHGKAYKLRPFKNQVEALRAMVDQAGLMSEIKESSFVYDDGARMRYDIVFDKLKIEPVINDIVKLRLRYWDSYDAAWSSQWSVEGYRLWCLNGCTTPDFNVRASSRHTSTETKFEEQVGRITSAVEEFHRSEDKFRRWVRAPVSVPEVDNLLRKTLAYLPPREGAAPNWSKNVVEEIKQRLVRQTVWDLYNSATAWASHPQNDMRRNRGSIHNVSRDRENRVAAMLRSEHWQAIAG